jgi:UDP-glucose 4-epimerase
VPRQQAPTKTVLVSGMGGELGSLVAARLEEQPWVGDLVGLDVDPPRRRLRRAQFHLIDPTNRARIVQLLAATDPQVIVHFAVYEPHARATASEAARWSAAAALNVLGAAAECPSLESIVVRSGIEVYGRGRGALTRPTEAAPVAPTSAFGRELADVERIAREVGDARGVPVTMLRFAPVLGPHVPSPLGRLLRLPVVPFDLLADAPFTVIDDRDAAIATSAAVRLAYDGPLNVVAPGATTARHAARRGRRIVAPVLGPQWPVVRLTSRALGAPVPDHVAELLGRGRLADATLAASVLDVAPTWSTPQVIDALYAWETVAHFHPHEHPIPRSVA